MSKTTAWWLACAGVMVAVPVQAQDAPPAGGGEGQLPDGVELPDGVPAAPDNVTVFQVPGRAPVPVPSGPGVNDHLPSSARVSTDTSSSSDGFDLSGGSARSSATVRGSANGAYVVAGQYTPEVHTVKRGDTLWDISTRYYGNPYNWPRIWSLNRQIQNPHWLYPGDHVRLRGRSGVREVSRLGLRRASVAPNTVFQRNVGYVLDGDHPVWGEVVGSPEDQMLLAQNDQAYIQLDKKHPIQVGTELVLFEEREVKNPGPHPFIWIRGRARVTRYNKNTGMARVLITESHTTIERGVEAGPADRTVDIVKPVRNKQTVQGRIVGALYPHEFYGQHQVVFINKGSDDGIEIGNRFFAVTRGDEWRRTLQKAGNMADKRALTEDDAVNRVVTTPDKDDPRSYPAETYGELRVLRTRKKTSTCLITASTREIPRGATIVAREGY